VAGLGELPGQGGAHVAGAEDEDVHGLVPCAVPGGGLDDYSIDLVKQDKHGFD
jgi:hypothetical protein